MNSNYRNTTAEINLSAVRHNLDMVRQYATSAKVMAVIKADAYGHGFLQLADALMSADAFAVASVDEGIVLRKYLQQKDCLKNIIILEGFNSIEELTAVNNYKLTAVVNNAYQLDMLVKEPVNLSDEMTIWLKFDTGMHRLGFQPGQLDSVLDSIQKLAEKVKIAGIMSHLACADEASTTQISEQQLIQFNKLIETFDLYYDYDYSMANSAAIITLPDSHYQWVRPGIMLYGVNPVENRIGSDIGLQQVMTLRSRIIAINSFAKGQCIGYGGSWCCPEDMQVGVVAIGYGDGYPRHAVSGTPVLLNGIKTQLIGRVSMDMITIDLRPFNNENTVKIGDIVTLWGEGLAAEDVAECSGTIAYELFCNVAKRVKYDYVSP